MQLLRNRHCRVNLIVKRLLHLPIASLDQPQASVRIFGRLRALFETLKSEVERTPALGGGAGAFLIGCGVCDGD